MLFVITAIGCGCASEPTKKVISSQDAVELDGKLLNIADMVSTRFQGEFVRGLARNAPATEMALLAITRNEATANVQALVLGPRPEADLVDLYVWTHLALQACENRNKLKNVADFDCASTYGDVNHSVVELAKASLSPEHLARIDLAIDKFFKGHPDLLTAGLIRLTDLADQTGTQLSVLQPASSDLFSGLTETARQLEQTRLLGQRVLWLVSRLPTIMGWEVDAQILVVLGNKTITSIPVGMEHVSESLKLHGGALDALSISMHSQGASIQALCNTVHALGEHVQGLDDSLSGDRGLRVIVRETLMTSGVILLVLIFVGTGCALLVVRYARSRRHRM